MVTRTSFPSPQFLFYFWESLTCISCVWINSTLQLLFFLGYSPNFKCSFTNSLSPCSAASNPEGSSTAAGVALRDQILKKTESLSLSSCQLPMALPLVVGFITASTSWELAWLDLLQVLCMQLQLLWFYVWDCPDASWKQFCYSHPPSLALKISPPPLLRLPPEHWEEGVWWAEHPEVSCSLYTDH